MVPKGANVKWELQDKTLQGKVQETYPEEVRLTLDDGVVIKHGTPKDRVLFIMDDAGKKYLRLESEVERV